MDIFLNPITISVFLLCFLCLVKLNVMFSLILACVVGGTLGGLSLMETFGIMLKGFNANAEAAMAYVLLGTFASCMSYTGIADILTRKVAKLAKGSKAFLVFFAIVIAIVSQTIIPVHIAFIPILIPPLLSVMNEIKMDRRLMAGALVFGMMPYVGVPLGYGLIFMNIVADNMVANGLTVAVADVVKVNWMLVFTFIPGMLYIWFRYQKPREYETLDEFNIIEAVETPRLQYGHWVSIIAILSTVVVQVITQSLVTAATFGLLVMFLLGAVKWKDIEEQFSEGINVMGNIAFVMLVAGGFGQVMSASGGVEALVNAAVSIMSGNKVISATVITLVGLLITMGIGTSFGTVPVLAVLYVPLCTQLGFSPSATILLLSAAAALGDAGSPASDATLGATCGLNVDKQHDHIWDTCVPTFLSFNIPLMVGAVIIAQFI
ncbi:MAG: TRAP transporter large permease subunit [Clostridia bacterium]|nr:TRAP transporter large permease subunit [Clostridia bacterium]